MKKRILRYFKHIILTLIVLLATGLSILVYLNGSINYGQNELGYHLDNEGPYVFYDTDSTLTVNYIKGNKKEGFYVDSNSYNINTKVAGSSLFQLDSTKINFNISSTIKTPKSIYNDGNKILAISDIESGFKAFRDFLIANKVIDTKLNWIFKKGHLVLVGDFVDRGYSTTQVLWFIYKLEQEAKKQGGTVHFILGNHELYNMQGQYKSAEKKYYAVASILGKREHDLYSKNSFLGRWMASKNTIELINGVLFAHGGIHPDITKYDISIETINTINRNNYYKTYYPKPQKTAAQFILSHKSGICWYRGYFKDDLSEDDVNKGLKFLNAKSIVVGHTVQSSVKKLFNGKVYAIDVKHPKDYISSWPVKKSEGLFIDKDKYYQVLFNGDKHEL